MSTHTRTHTLTYTQVLANLPSLVPVSLHIPGIPGIPGNSDAGQAVRVPALGIRKCEAPPQDVGKKVYNCICT